MANPDPTEPTRSPEWDREALRHLVGKWLAYTALQKDEQLRIINGLADAILALAKPTPQDSDKTSGEVARVIEAWTTPGRYLDFPGAGKNDWSARAVLIALARTDAPSISEGGERSRYITTWLSKGRVLDWEHYVSDDRSEAEHVVANLKNQGVIQWCTFRLGEDVAELSVDFNAKSTDAPSISEGGK